MQAAQVAVRSRGTFNAITSSLSYLIIFDWRAILALLILNTRGGRTEREGEGD